MNRLFLKRWIFISWQFSWYDSKVFWVWFGRGYQEILVCNLTYQYQNIHIQPSAIISVACFIQRIGPWSDPKQEFEELINYTWNEAIKHTSKSNGIMYMRKRNHEQSGMSCSLWKENEDECKQRFRNQKLMRRNETRPNFCIWNTSCKIPGKKDKNCLV